MSSVRSQSPRGFGGAIFTGVPVDANGAITDAGAYIVVRASHNVASVTRTAAGRYRVTFAAPMPDANYCWTALARSSTNSGTQRIAIVRSTTDQKTAQYVDISCATTAASFDDSTEINLTVHR